VIPASIVDSGKEYKNRNRTDVLEARMSKTEGGPTEMISAPRKSRPLSASRRQRTEDRSLLDQSSEDIVNAILAENETVEASRNSNSIARESKSAPSKESAMDVESDTLQRPYSIATTAVDDVMIKEIVERVKCLSGRQQISLLKMLTKLEELDVTEDDARFGTMFFEKNRQRLSSGTGEIQTSESIEKSSLGKAFAEDNVADVQEGEEDENSSSNATIVCLEIISNWGHADIVGLTEVDFIDKDEKVICLKAENVGIETEHISYGPIHCLVNGKAKTTKDRHMWKCKLDTAEPIKLVFRVPRDLSSSDQHRISKIAIWNYNKSLYDLNAGVKEARIFINGEKIWDGIIDKGCGNQVFDYSKVISLHDEEKNEERCKTAILKRDSSELANLPKIDSSIEDQSASEGISSDASNEERVVVHPIPKPPSTKAEHPTRSSPMIRRHIPEVAGSVEAAHRSSNVEETDFESQKFEDQSNQKPIWLPGEDSLKGESTLDVDGDIASISKPRSRPSSGRRAEAQQAADDGHPASIRTASAGRRKGKHVKKDDELIDDGEKDEPVSLYEGSKRKTPSSGRRSKVDDVPAPMEKGTQEFSQRRKFRELVDDELEQSLNSINIFDHSHRGRITSDLDLEKDQGDALDHLIKPLAAISEAHSNKSLSDENTEDISEISTAFEIPTLPSGHTLVLNLRTTWGDKHYIGLNGIEVFTDKGELANISDISANPADINILPEYDHDPRVVTNLIDGVYMTRDDLHLWLTPFTHGMSHFVKINFEKAVTIAMLRIWNYNKSRIHSTRGARYVEISLDDATIFKGEIARASGVLSKEAEPYGDIILFTTDEDILEEVAKHDFTYEYDIYDSEEEQMIQSVEQNRPKTADESDFSEILDRPYTCPKSRRNDCSQFMSQEEAYHVESDQPLQTEYAGKVVRLNFTETWGDEYYLGLTGIEVLGENFESIPVDMEWMEAFPRDLNDLDDYDDDDRTLDKLIDGENVTTSDEHMWLIPFSAGESHTITITFPEKKRLTGIRIWNYNKSTEDTYRGAKVMQLFIDDVELFPDHGFLLRKGPGHCHFDFAQDILFSQEEELHERKDRAKEDSRGRQDLEGLLLLPTGFVFQVRLLSTWGDPYYVGLNGIEFYDEYGVKIPLDENNVTAYPHSVNVLEGMENDARTPDKLVDGVNDTYDASHMWLAPVFPGIVNVVYVVFDSPIALSMIKIWNYSKTGVRGVKQFSILVDDLLVYNGILPQVTHHTRAILPQIDLPIHHHTILFTDDEEIFETAPKNVLSKVASDIEQDVQMTNEKSVVNPYVNPTSAGKTVDPAKRPMTSVTNAKPRR